MCKFKGAIDSIQLPVGVERSWIVSYSKSIVAINCKETTCICLKHPDLLLKHSVFCIDEKDQNV